MSGTIKAKENFNAEIAAKQFKNALRGLGTDEQAIIKLLVGHTFEQRLEIVNEYKAMYGRDLADDLKEELGGNFEAAVLMMLSPPAASLVEALRESLQAVDTDEDTLIEVLCAEDAQGEETLNHWYQEKFDMSLDDALEDGLSGDFRDFMRSLATAERPADGPPDQDDAKKTAQDLYDAGIGANASTDEYEFINILNNNSFSQLKLMFEEYESIASESVEDSIEKEFSGDLKHGLLALVNRARDPLAFYATRLNKSMESVGADDISLMRLLVTRSEIDLADVKKKYKELHGRELYDDVRRETSGDYQKLLLAIIGK